jgi:hypothetical protein
MWRRPVLGRSPVRPFPPATKRGGALDPMVDDIVDI